MNRSGLLMGKIAKSVLVAIPIVSFAYMLLLLTFCVGRGFDFTDESFYILWAMYPDEVEGSITRFGMLTQFLFRLAGRDIASFRMLGIVILLLVGLGFSRSLTRFVDARLDGALTRSTIWAMTSLVLASTLTYYESLVLTPSYNWLALVGCLLVATAMIRIATLNDEQGADVVWTRRALPNVCMLACGGLIAFAGKPSTAAVLAIFTAMLMCLPDFRISRIRLLASSAILSFVALCLHIQLLEGGFASFYAEMKLGYELQMTIDARYFAQSLVGRLIADLFVSLPKHVAKMGSIALLMGSGLMLITTFSPNLLRRDRILVVAISSLPVLAALQVHSFDHHARNLTTSSLTVFLVVSLLALMIAVWRQRLVESNRAHISGSKSLVVWMVFFFALAVAYGFGSASNITRKMGEATVFLVSVCAVIALMVDRKCSSNWFSSVTFAAISSLLVVLCTHSLREPYRLTGSIWQQNSRIELLGNPSSLDVHPDTARYIHDVQELALSAGWIPSNFLIDLSGQSPGLNVVLGARFIGRPWLIGGYLKSNQFVLKALQSGRDESLRLAWVLTSGEGKRRLESSILANLNLPCPDGDAWRGDVQMAGRPKETYTLWKPR